MSSDYGRRLREARTHARLTQEKLSAKTGIPQTTISTAERNGQGSSDTTYAKACGVDAHWLATGEGDMLPSVTTHSAPAVALTPILSLQTVLIDLEPAARERAGVLLGHLVKDPGGPWAVFLSTLIGEKQPK